MPPRASRPNGDRDVAMGDAPEIVNKNLADAMDVDDTPQDTEDSDTNPNTTASSVNGDPVDGRRRRSRPHSSAAVCSARSTIVLVNHRRMTPSADSDTFLV